MRREPVAGRRRARGRGHIIDHAALIRCRLRAVFGYDHDVWLALCLLVAACGRVGFDEHRGNGGAFDGGALDGARAPDSYDGPGTIDLVVESEGSNAGMPVGGADVLVENGSGFDRTTTAADGTASFSVAGPTTFHVAYLVSGLWRVYTINAARAGSTVTLGGKPGAPRPAHRWRSASRREPAAPTATASGCARTRRTTAARPSRSSWTLSSCEGRTVHLFAYDLSTSDDYIDAGPLTLKANATFAVPGAYQAMPSHAVHVANLPANTQSVYATIEARGERRCDRPRPRPGDRQPERLHARHHGRRAADRQPAGLQFNGVQSNPISAFGFEFLPTDTAGNVSVDAAGALPVFTTMTTAPATAGIAWSPLVNAGVIYAVDATASNVHWTAYVDAGTDHVAFPALPADLAAAIPATWNDADVDAVRRPGQERGHAGHDDPS